jgi:ADP-glucose pyrophosphorylase
VIRDSVVEDGAVIEGAILEGSIIGRKAEVIGRAAIMNVGDTTKVTV